MRNIIIGLVVVLMVGWAIFEFTGEKSEEKQLAAQRAALLKEQQQLNAKQEAFEGFGIKVGDMGFPINAKEMGRLYANLVQPGLMQVLTSGRI
mgnify:CR=1 FL=1